jgi:hypothetical protein
VPGSRGGLHESVTAVESAAELEAAGRFREAAQVLERLPRAEREPMVDVRVVHLRHRAFAELLDGQPSTRPAPAVDDFPGEVRAPEVHASELTSEILSSAIHFHGGLIVRGLLPELECERLRSDIDQAFTAFDNRGMGRPTEQTAPWFARLELDDGFEPPDPLATAFLRSAGGVYAPFAPRAFVEYRNALEDVGLIDVIGGHLGEVPVLSANKFVLRRIGGGAQPSWHQDGSYLGVDIRAVNLWLALSECGADTDVMGLEIIPGRRHALAAMGTHDAPDPRAISEQVAESLAADLGRPIDRPLFRPGDGILFDQLFVHRSDTRPLPRERYAIESWFLTRSGYPPHMIPVVAS